MHANPRESPPKTKPIPPNPRKCKQYFLIEPGRKVYFNSDFDSGNLAQVQQLGPHHYRLHPGCDQLKGGTQKTYFHFRVYGFVRCGVRFVITRVGILEKLLKKGQEELYKPIVRRGEGSYQPLESGVKVYYNKQDEVELSIQYQFGMEDVWTEFSFAYPYGYEDVGKMVKGLRAKYHSHGQIYFRDECLGCSGEGRKLKMVTVTERQNCTEEKEESFEKIFEGDSKKQPTENHTIGTRPWKINKPKIVITGRVHPGESPSSYCVQGLLKFLLDEKDYRAYLLRKNFHFIILPMLNPDGVYHGMFRSDPCGDNLNRVYQTCSRAKHPTIWYFREYMKYLKQGPNPVVFYFDFHAHPSKKQFFIYGNSFNEFTQQVQAQTFGKLLENNCPFFHNIDSIFSQKQMISKDKNDSSTKQGCARVYMHKLFSIIHSYTVQCGYFAPGKLHPSIPVPNPFLAQPSPYCYVPTWQDLPSCQAYTPQSYLLMGKSILITILDLFHLNPYTRVPETQYKSIGNIRKAVAAKIYAEVQRYRLVDANVAKKMKDMDKRIEEEYYKSKVGQYGLSVSENYGMVRPKKSFSLLARVYQSKSELDKKQARQMKLSGSNPPKNFEFVSQFEPRVQERPSLTALKQLSNIKFSEQVHENVRAHTKRDMSTKNQNHFKNLSQLSIENSALTGTKNIGHSLSARCLKSQRQSTKVEAKCGKKKVDDHQRRDKDIVSIIKTEVRQFSRHSTSEKLITKISSQRRLSSNPDWLHKDLMERPHTPSSQILVNNHQTGLILNKKLTPLSKKSKPLIKVPVNITDLQRYVTQKVREGMNKYL